MSYEGYVEKLCANGHLSSFDCYDEPGDHINCSCGAEFVFRHAVDQTNGIEYDENDVPYPNTIDYPFENNGFIDEWHKDHHGNLYATKTFRYKIPK